MYRGLAPCLPVCPEYIMCTPAQLKLHMLKEFFVPLATLVCSMVACVGCIHWLCKFHQIYLTTSARLDSELWLVTQCEDPLFFSKMHSHTDLCFTVTDNARVGAWMLSLQDFTHGFISAYTPPRGMMDWGWGVRWIFSWGGCSVLAMVLLLGPSWVFSGTRAIGRRWPECRDLHFKDA